MSHTQDAEVEAGREYLLHTGDRLRLIVKRVDSYDETHHYEKTKKGRTFHSVLYAGMHAY